MMPLIIANLKCNPSTLREARRLFISLKKGLGNIRKAQVVVCPPFLYIPELIKIFGRAGKIKFGAQDCFWEKEGAFTGEVSPLSLKSIGVSFVILGHSERRINFAESDEMINKKLKAALSVGLLPILCVGETKKERREGRTFQVLKKELRVGLKGVSAKNASKIILAYEPIWAIGSGKPCELNEIIVEVLSIRKIIAALYRKKVAREVKVVYGGSIDAENISKYSTDSNLQGFLIGGSSFNSREFMKIVGTIVKKNSDFNF